MATTLLNTSDIESIVIQTGLDNLLDELIAQLAIEFANMGRNKALIPPRSGIQYMNPDLGLIEWMPASVATGTATLKIVAYHPTNPIKRKLPTVISSICVFDTKSGHLKGILDGTFLTALRTGAMSAVATRLLGHEGSRNLGIIGCGAQAVTQAHALSRVIQFDSILAYDVDDKSLNNLEQRISFTGLKVKPIKKSQLSKLLEQSDVLCTCTSESPGQGPLFSDFAHKPWLHINAVGSDFPDKYELPIDFLKKSYVCPDFHDQAIVEGECQQLNPQDIGDELGSLLNKPELSQVHRNSLTVFDSTGHAFADYVTGLLFMNYAEKLGLGTEVEIECLPEDPKDPYSFLTESTQSMLRSSASIATARTR